MTDKAKVKAAKARADALTPEQRKAIARKAALARWDAEIPQATHEGPLLIGGAEASAAVLENGTRILTQATFLRSLGRSRSPKAGTGVYTTVDGMPFFLQAEILKPYISDDLRMSTAPIFFKTKEGKKGVGYDARLLPQVCEVYLRFRDDLLANKQEIPRQYERIIRACDALMRGLATVGIVALVDEATGYQYERERLALQAILEKYLRKELAQWVKVLPDEFYEQIYRLRDWKWRGMSVNRPQVVASYTKDLVYSRLAPKILQELESRNPIDAKGRRLAKHHQWLTDDIGNPSLRQHLFGLIVLMRASENWDDFMRKVDEALPKCGDTMRLPFMAQPIVISESSSTSEGQ